jgi:DNA-binding beta-propeller fold protein YncE
MAIDLATGAARRLARVPGLGAGGLVVTNTRIYVPDPERNAVSMVDRRRGRLIGSLPAGAGPGGIALAGAAKR